MGYMETYKAWCENEYFDEDTRAELKSIAGDEKEIEDRFYKDLDFLSMVTDVYYNHTSEAEIHLSHIDFPSICLFLTLSSSL